MSSKFEEHPREWEFIDPDPDGWAYNDLRTIAKELGLETGANPRKRELMEQVAAEINDHSGCD